MPSTDSIEPKPDSASAASIPSYRVWTRVSRSAKRDNRRRTMSNAVGSRSMPITRSPGSSLRNRSACPPAPTVASMSTAPDPSGWWRVNAGRSSVKQRSSRTGTWPNSPVASAMTTPSRRVAGEATRRSVASRSLSDFTNLALGKYVRVGSDRGHDARARALDNVAECFIAGRGEVLFMGVLVLLPGECVPDLQVVNRSDYHAVLGEVRVAAVIGRQGDPALGVGMLFVGAGGQVAQEGSGVRVASRRLTGLAGEFLERHSRVNGEAVVLALGDHQPPCQCVAELGGQREPPLVVELWRVGAEKHLATSTFDFRHDTPQSPTSLHLTTRMSPVDVVSAGSRPPRWRPGIERACRTATEVAVELQLLPRWGVVGDLGVDCRQVGVSAHKKGQPAGCPFLSRALLLEAAAE